MTERWKPITDPPNIQNAFVSNTGKVMYLNNRLLFKTTIGSPQNGKYMQVKLSDKYNNKRKYCVHLLVAKQWLTKKCKAFTVVHHIDANRQNNHVNNLQYTTQLLNCSLRTNSTMCILKNGRFISKFIFAGEIVKSNISFETPEEARANALKMRERMYISAYNSLIQNEMAEEEKVTSELDSTDIRICCKSEN